MENVINEEAINSLKNISDHCHPFDEHNKTTRNDVIKAMNETREKEQIKEIWEKIIDYVQQELAKSTRHQSQVNISKRNSEETFDLLMKAYSKWYFDEVIEHIEDQGFTIGGLGTSYLINNGWESYYMTIHLSD